MSSKIHQGQDLAGLPPASHGQVCKISPSITAWCMQQAKPRVFIFLCNAAVIQNAEQILYIFFKQEQDKTRRKCFLNWDFTVKQGVLSCWFAQLSPIVQTFPDSHHKLAETLSPQKRKGGDTSMLQIGRKPCARQSLNLMALARDPLWGAVKAGSLKHRGSSGRPHFPTNRERHCLCFGNKHHHPSSGGLDAYTHSFLLSSAVSVQADELTLLSFPCISCRDEFCRSNKY